MFLGKVIGTVWATKKQKDLEGLRFLIVCPYNFKDGKAVQSSDTVVVADVLGAGVGENVIVAYGKAARSAISSPDMPIEAAIIAIVDKWELEGRYIFPS